MFRLEKTASSGDLLITEQLALRLHDGPARRKFSVETLQVGPLKGLEPRGVQTVYRLRLPRRPDALDLQFPSVYRDKRRALALSCREIHVFGKVYDSIPMDENFIQLRLDPVSRRKAASDPEGQRASRYAEIRRGMDYREYFESDGMREFEQETRFTPEKLHASRMNGVILGLPGAGKTTILRYLVHRTLIANAIPSAD